MTASTANIVTSIAVDVSANSDIHHSLAGKTGYTPVPQMKKNPHMGIEAPLEAGDLRKGCRDPGYAILDCPLFYAHRHRQLTII